VRVLVTGASGYLGSRIVPELLRRGHQVVAAGTGEVPPDAPWVDQADWRQVDVFDLRVLAAALENVDAVVYLIHGLGDADFSRMDREASENMRDAVDLTGVRRVVYFSGIVPDVHPDELSEHLRSRLEVEEILAQSHASTLALRAAIVVGAGSTSFEVVRQISERLPLVQTIPTWMRDTVVQPIAVADAVHYVAEAVEHSDVTGRLDVAGPDRVTYPELLDLYADAAGLIRVQVPVPAIPEDVVGWLAGQLTDVDTATVQSLLASLRHDMVADLGPTTAAFGPYERVSLREAVRQAIASDPTALAERDGAAIGGMPARPSSVDRI
jgi:uncharacterized protein YbjT (DUF2867 family)